MSNSSLVDYVKISPNKNTPRQSKIDTITIHCVVGQLSVESLGDIFANSNKKASSNYGIGKDGRIGLYVEEKDRSWCSSNYTNDNRAVTIECASDTTHPYKINDDVYKSLIKLCVDICKRNGKKKMMWFADKTRTLEYKPKDDEMLVTVHKWFANKECPGQYIYERLGIISGEVTRQLNEDEDKEDSFLVSVDITNLNIRKGPGTNYVATGKHTGKGVFTITEVKSGKGSVKGWGKLKSGAGWISLDYAKRI